MTQDWREALASYRRQLDPPAPIQPRVPIEHQQGSMHMQNLALVSRNLLRRMVDREELEALVRLGYPRLKTLLANPGEINRIQACSGRTPPTFSCNPAHNVWRYWTRGLTPHEVRVPLEGKFSVLDNIVTAMLEMYPKGGRFHVYSGGATHAGEDAEFVELTLPFVLFVKTNATG